MIHEKYENIVEYYRQIILNITLQEYTLDHSIFDLPVTMEPPRDPEHGDLATNIAMVIAKKVKISPKVIAEKILVQLEKEEDIAKANIAGPGFINININIAVWGSMVSHIVSKAQNFGDVNVGKNQKVNVEYVSANPTGPMHIGHARGAVIGDVLASIYEKCGYDVTREYYMNDAGSQIDLLAHSLYFRYQELCGMEKREFPENFYPGEYIITAAQKFFDKHGKKYYQENEEIYIPVFKNFAIQEMMALIKGDLAKLYIKHNVFTSEKKLVEDKVIEAAVAQLQKHDFIYRGVLEPPKGKKLDDWEPREQLLFKATAFGDDVDRPLQKSNGQWTYFANDIAYHWDKYQRGFAKMIDIFGADHAGYIKRMTSATKAITNHQGDLSIITAQIVRFMDKGDAIKMSKRAGNFVTLRDLIDDIGADAIRVFMLSRKADSMLDFDLSKVIEENKDNPVFYLHYAHARTYSIEKLAKEVFHHNIIEEAIKNASLLGHYYTHEKYCEFIKKMAFYPRILTQAATYNEPHRLLFFLLECASLFHSIWTKGRESEEFRFIDKENKEKTLAKLALLLAFRYVMQSGAKVIGLRLKEEL